MHNKLYYLITILLSCTQFSFSQVTIGSSEKPVEGSLLQLKNLPEVNGSANANRGLLLPRVALINNSTLSPCAEDTYSLEHTGLIVYNITSIALKPVSSCDPSPDLSKVVYTGINVWNGEQWNSLNSEDNKLEKPAWYDDDVKYIKDHEGNIYPVKEFGTEGIWMLENLRTKSVPNNNTGYPTSIGTSTPTRIKSGVHTGDYSISTVMNLNKNFYNFPSPPDAYNSYYGDDVYPSYSDNTFFQKYNNVGLRYNFYMSFNNDETKLVDTEPDSKSGFVKVSKDSNGNYKNVVQGICPQGWHIPFQAEFVSLFQSIVDLENANDPLSGVDSEFALANNITDARYPLTACLPMGENDDTRGASKPSLLGGFAGMWVGADSPYPSNAATPTVLDKNGPKEYGILSVFTAVMDSKLATTSVPVPSDPDYLLLGNYWYSNVWIRPYDPLTGVGVTTWQLTPSVKTNLYPVRCKKDNKTTSDLLEFEDVYF